MSRIPTGRPDDGPVIRAFSIRDDGSVQLDYYEKAESTAKAFHMHSLVADASVLTNLDDILEDLLEAWNDILIHIRNPVASFVEGEAEDGD